MAGVDNLIEFAERYVVTKEGVRWRLKGREWIRDHFWRPADGWKLWRKEGSNPCTECAANIGTIVDHPDDNDTMTCACGGLAAEPILVTIVNLARGDGKTLNLAAYSLAHLCLGRGDSQAGIWASEDQGNRIVEETWLPTINASKKLSKLLNVHGTPTKIECSKTSSLFETMASSRRSITGRRRRRILIDEGRDIPAGVISALIPSINAMHGVECPRGHVQLTPEEVEQMESVPKECTACGERLTPWYPRIIITSASGVLSGTERDWMHELIEELRARPRPNYHLFTSANFNGVLNPRKSEHVTAAIHDVFGSLPSMAHYMDAETGNAWTKKGADVVSIGDVKACMHVLPEASGSKRKCIGFVDTSTTVDKTSIVLLEDDEDSQYPFERVVVSHVEYWQPGKNCGKTIPADEVKRALMSLMPLYPGLESLHIDVQAGAKRAPEYLWPTLMIRDIRVETSAKWKDKIRIWHNGGKDDVSDEAWSLLVERIVGKTIKLPQMQEIIDEFKGITFRPSGQDGLYRVVDRDRSKMHRDIIQSIAQLCYLAARVGEKLRRREKSWLSLRNQRSPSLKNRKLGPESL